MSSLTKIKKIFEIVEIKELISPNDVNSHIKLGWKLINTYKSINTDKKQTINYCIGWPESAGNIQQPDGLPALNASSVKSSSVKSSSVKRKSSKKNKQIYSL